MIDFAVDSPDKAPVDAPRESLDRLSQLAHRLLNAQRESARLDAELIIAEAVQRKLAEVDLPELMRELTIKKFVFEDGTEIELKDEIDCGISEANQPEAYAWLREKKLDGVIKTVVAISFPKGERAMAIKLAEALREEQGLNAELSETVHYQTLKALLKEQGAKGVNIPPEPFGYHPYSITKVKPPRGQASPAKVRKRK